MMDFNDFRNEVIAHSRPSKESWIYRGQRISNWPLDTSYARFFHKATADAPTDFSLSSFEVMLNRFIRRSSEAEGHDYSVYTLPQQIALAQHHGIPTPFLDWTYSPYIAVYFGLAPSPDDPHDMESPFGVHALRIDAEAPLGQIKTDEDLKDLQEEEVKFIDTNRFFSRRIIHQQGCFTFQNFAGCLTEKTKGFFRAFEIDDDHDKMRRELTLMGITAGNLFDDLGHIARDVAEAERQILRLGSRR